MVGGGERTGWCHSLIKRLDDTEHGHDDVNCRVAVVPEFVELDQGPFDIALLAVPHEVLHDERVWLVAYFEYVVTANETKTRVCGLKVVDGLSHVPFASEYESF